MLKSLHVQHYKSLADIHLKFSPITVLVGQNGSGKSNVVDALRFVRDALVHGLDHAISERGGIEILRQYAPMKPYMLSLKVEFDYPIDDTVYPAHYAFKLVGSGSNVRIESEEATWSSESFRIEEGDKEGQTWKSLGILLHNFRRDRSGKVFIDGDEPRKIEAPADQLAIRAFSRFTHFFELGVGVGVAQTLGNMRFASIYPNILRHPSRPDTDKLLKEDCSNWASVLKAMRQRKAGERILERITELMRQVMPGLEQVTVKLIGGYLVPQFLVKETPTAKAHYFDPVQLSDGTLRLFGIFLSLYQLPHPDFLALEEPELTIHPGLISLLAEASREVSERTQILITTHSPYLLDHFDPEEIKVVSMKDGETRVSNIRKSQVETVKKRLMTLSEVMTLDGLRPE